MKNTTLCVIALSTVGVFANAQTVEKLNLNAIGRDPHWKVAGRTTSLVEVKGKRALKISEGPGIGLVWRDGFDFSKGVIELNMLGRSRPVQGSFIGIAFRVVDARTQDVVYFRPFNFQAADPLRQSHAVQYASHPRWPWERLRSEHPGEYERAVMPQLDGDQWFRVRIVVERPNVSVFVNGSRTPCLAVKELSDRVGGSVGLWVGDGSGGYFADLSVTRLR